jgi:hypothetical protein
MFLPAGDFAVPGRHAPKSAAIVAVQAEVFWYVRDGLPSKMASVFRH